MCFKTFFWNFLNNDSMSLTYAVVDRKAKKQKGRHGTILMGHSVSWMELGEIFFLFNWRCQKPFIHCTANSKWFNELLLLLLQSFKIFCIIYYCKMVNDQPIGQIKCYVFWIVDMKRIYFTLYTQRLKGTWFKLWTKKV